MPTSRASNRLLAVLSCSLLAGIAGAAAGGPEQTWIDLPSFVQPEDRNAAIRYWRTLSMLDGEAADRIRSVDWEAIGDSFEPAVLPSWYDAATETGALARSVADGLVDAAEMDRCNFEIDYENGIHTLLPHLAPMRTGAYLLRLRAREAAIDGRPEAAAESLAAIVRMGRHAAQDPVLICALVGVAMTNQALEETESMLRAGVLTPAARRIVAEALHALPEADPMGIRAALEGERLIFLGWLDSIAADRAALDAMVEASGVSDDETGRAFRALVNEGPDAVRRSVRDADQAYRALLDAWDEAEADRVFDDFNTRLANGEFGLIARVMLPSFERVSDADRTFRERLARVSAALED